jgi:hypothetical protein
MDKFRECRDDRYDVDVHDTCIWALELYTQLEPCSIVVRGLSCALKTAGF